MLESIKGAARTVKDTVAGVFGSGFDALKGQVDELSETAPALAELGYRLLEIDIDFTIPPKVVVVLERDNAVTDEAFQAVLANNAGKTTFCLVVGMLRKVNGLIGSTHIKGRVLRGVEVSLGLPPGVKLRFL